MPRPGSTVIHPGTLTGLRRVAESAQTGRCQLLIPRTGTTLNPDTFRYDDTDPSVEWEGSCRFQPVRSRGGGNVVTAGEQPVTLDTVQLTIPLSAPEPAVNWLVRILTSSDPRLTGKTFRVLSVGFGTLQAERHLVLQDNETSRPGT